jgi:hypothetical protein
MWLTEGQGIQKMHITKKFHHVESILVFPNPFENPNPWNKACFELPDISEVHGMGELFIQEKIVVKKDGVFILLVMACWCILSLRLQVTRSNICFSKDVSN